MSEESPQVSTSTEQRKPRRQAPRRGNARQQRTDAFREEKNKETLAKRAVDEGVRTGFIDPPSSRRPPPPRNNKTQTDLPVTAPTGFPEIGMDVVTRLVPFSPFGIALMVNDFYVRFRESFGVECNVWQFYRFTLAQLEYQAFVAHQSAVSPYPFSNPRTEFAEPLQRVLKGYPENFRAIVAAIECYGHFACGDARMCTEFGPDAMFSPYNVRFGNLRLILNILEQGNNPAFIARNPIPGAVYEEGILQNAADILPLGYGAQELELDAESVRAGFDAMKNKYGSFIAMCSYNGVGKPSTLVTLDVTRPSDRIPPIPPVGDEMPISHRVRGAPLPQPDPNAQADWAYVRPRLMPTVCVEHTWYILRTIQPTTTSLGVLSYSGVWSNGLSIMWREYQSRYTGVSESKLVANWRTVFNQVMPQVRKSQQ